MDYSKQPADSTTEHANLTQRMSIALEEQTLTDVVFRITNNYDLCTGQISEVNAAQVTEIRAHKVILAIGSPVFKAMFFGLLKEMDIVTVPDISPEVFRIMLNYIYTDKVELTPKDVMEVIYASKKYDVTGLQDRCRNWIDEKLSRDNAPTIYDQAVKYFEDSIAEKALALIDRFAHYVINTNDVVNQFSRELFTIILKRDTFCAREVDIWDALIWWAKQRLPNAQHDMASIREYLGDMIFYIRFPQMTIKELLQIVIPVGLLQGAEVNEALMHTFVRKKRASNPATTMFPTHRRWQNEPVVIKVSQLPGNELYKHKLEHNPDGTPNSTMPPLRFERVADKGCRSIRIRSDHRMFLTKLCLAGVPARFTTDNYVVTLRIIDTILNELILSTEFILTRAGGEAPATAAYKLDMEPVEFCPKILYELNLSIDRANPELTIVRVMEIRDYNIVRLQHYEKGMVTDGIFVDELHFMT